MSKDIRRYLVILELLKEADGLVTSRQIEAGQRKEDLGFSSTTLSNDIRALVGFGFKIHNAKTKGYALEIEQTDEFSFLTNLFKRIALSNLLNKSTTLKKEAHKYLSLDDTSLVKNFQYFDIILEAIKKRKEINFKHQSFYHTRLSVPKIQL